MLLQSYKKIKPGFNIYNLYFIILTKIKIREEI